MDFSIFVLILAVSLIMMASGVIFRWPVMFFIAGMMWFVVLLPVAELTTASSIESLPVESTTNFFTRELWYDVTSHTTGATLGGANLSVVERFAAGSSLEGKLIDCISIPMQPIGAPPASTLITVGVLDDSNNFRKIFGTMNVTSMQSSVTTYDFCLPQGDAYLVQADDRIGGHYPDGDASNRIQLRVDDSNPFGGTDDRYEVYTSSWGAVTGRDLTMQITFSVNREIVTTEYQPFYVENTEEIEPAFRIMIGIGASLIIMGGYLLLREN